MAALYYPERELVLADRPPTMQDKLEPWTRWLDSATGREYRTRDGGRWAHLPEAEQPFVPEGYVWSLNATGVTGAVITVTQTLLGVDTVLNTLVLPAGGVVRDGYEKLAGATYKWSSTAADTSVEIV